jgi:TctA family transporter
MSHNDPSIFFTRPISAVLLVVAFISLALPVFQSFRKVRAGEETVLA